MQSWKALKLLKCKQMIARLDVVQISIYTNKNQQETAK